MDEKIIAILEKIIMAGGNGLAGKDFKALGVDKKVTSQMLDAGFLSKNNGKYDLTETGLSSWETERGAAYVTKLRDDTIANLLTSLSKNTVVSGNDSGKQPSGERGTRKFTPTRPAIPPKWYEEAKQQGFLDETGAGDLRLLSTGEAWLFARLPVEEQLSRRRSGYQAKVEQLLQEHAVLAQQCVQLRKEIPVGFGVAEELDKLRESLREELQRKVHELCAAYDKSLQTLAGFSGFLSAGQKFAAQVKQENNATVAKIERACQDARKAWSQVSDRLTAHFMVLQDSIRQVKHKADDLSIEIHNWRGPSSVITHNTDTVRLVVNEITPGPFPRIDVTKAPDQPHATAVIQSQPPQIISEEEIFQAMKLAHEQYCQNNAVATLNVPIPEIFGLLHAQGVVGDNATFHRLLRKWVDSNRLEFRATDNSISLPKT